MRILFAVHGYKPAYRLGGPIISVSALAEKLVSRGHEVIVFTTNSNLDEDLDVPADQPIVVDGVEVWYFRRDDFIQNRMGFLPYLAKSIGFLYASRMRSELDRVVPKVDIVHTHMPFIYPTYAASRAALRHGKPLFYHQRGVFDPKRLSFRSWKKWLYIRLFERPVLRRATTLVALTPAEVTSYRALGTSTHCEVIPNGIHVDRYRTIPVGNVDSRWGISPGSQVVLFMGRIHPIKGADLLVDAFMEVADRVPSAVLVMAGPDEFGLEQQMRVRVEERGLAGRVVFTGMVSGEDKLDLLARADLFCLPSDAEGFSIAILEALASGTAVLISPGCHFPEVQTAGAGVVAAPTSSAFAAAMAELLERPQELREMGARGRAFVSERYGWDEIADNMIAAYERALRS